MVRTSPFSIRLTKEVREMIEENAEALKIKPSVLAAMVLRDCTDKWTREYAEEIYKKFHGDERN